MTVSPNMDRNTTNQAQMQLNFIDFIVAPTFAALNVLLPDVDIFCKTLKENRRRWKEILEPQLLKEEKKKKDKKEKKGGEQEKKASSDRKAKRKSFRQTLNMWKERENSFKESDAARKQTNSTSRVKGLSLLPGKLELTNSGQTTSTGTALCHEILQATEHKITDVLFGKDGITKLSHLFDLVSELTACVSIPELMEKVSKGCKSILPHIKTSYLIVVDSYANQLWTIQDGRQKRWPISNEDLPGTAVISGEVATNGKASRQSFNVVCVPLCAKESTVGVIEIMNEESQFSSKDVALLELLACQIAVILEKL